MLLNAGLVPFPLNNEITMYWTMWATIGTAAVTVLLALFAARAWMTSRRTLVEMENQGKADLAERQTAREVDALADYLRVLSEVPTMHVEAPNIAFGGDEVTRAIEETMAYEIYIDQVVIPPIALSGMIWRLQHHRNASQLDEFLRAEETLLNFLGMLPVLRDAERLREVMTCQFFVMRFLPLLRDWQMNESSRDQHAEEVSQLEAELEADFKRVTASFDQVIEKRKRAVEAGPGKSKIRIFLDQIWMPR